MWGFFTEPLAVLAPPRLAEQVRCGQSKQRDEAVSAHPPLGRRITGVPEAQPAPTAVVVAVGAQHRPVGEDSHVLSYTPDLHGDVPRLVTIDRYENLVAIDSAVAQDPMHGIGIDRAQVRFVTSTLHQRPRGTQGRRGAAQARHAQPRP